MKLSSFLSLAALVTFMSSCGNGNLKTTANNSAMSSSNPFYAPSTLPFQAADFDKIKNSDYKPAIEEGMKQQLDEVAKIADNTEAPSFENTFTALEKSGQLLRRVSGVFGLITSANTNPELQKLQEEMAPKLAAVNDAIFLNTKLFKRVFSIIRCNFSRVLIISVGAERLHNNFFQQNRRALLQLEKNESFFSPKKTKNIILS